MTHRPAYNTEDESQLHIPFPRASPMDTGRPSTEQHDGIFHFVTCRLLDSLPREQLARWRKERIAWLASHPKPWDGADTESYREHFPRRLEHWLDEGHGACYLRNPYNAEILAKALHHFDGERYDLVAFVVMPSHVHVLLQLRDGHDLEDSLHWWKNYSTRKIDQLLSSKSPLWQDENWEHLLHGTAERDRSLAYIAQNPKDAHLRQDEHLLYEAPDQYRVDPI